MTEVTNERSAKSRTTAKPAWLSQQLLKIVPVVESLSDGLRNLLLLLLLAGLGIGGWLVWGQGLGWPWVITVTILILLPAAILLRFWLALESLRAVPDFMREATTETGAELVSSLRSAKSTAKKSGLQLFGYARQLWTLRSLLGDAGDVLQDSLNIGILLNPLALLLGVIALLAAGIILIASVIILVITIF